MLSRLSTRWLLYHHPIPRFTFMPGIQGMHHLRMHRQVQNFKIRMNKQYVPRRPSAGPHDLPAHQPLRHLLLPRHLRRFQAEATGHSRT